MFTKLKQLFLADKTSSLETFDTLYKPSDNFNVFLNKLNTYFKKNPSEQQQFENELNYLNHLSHISEEEKKLYSIMPYPFTSKYSHQKTDVFKDEETGLFYVYLDGKRLYYHRGFTNPEAVQKSFTYISAEQDAESPHRYLDETVFYVNEGDTVVDLGAAEGNFSLSVADKVKELFIVEADSQWIPALHKTFEPWKHKVHIINKFVGNNNSDTEITLTELSKQFKINVVKMDIEGAEMNVLQEAKDWIEKQRLRFAITTYHQQDDAERIKTLLSACGYQTLFSDKFILFIYDFLQPPYFRKGLLKARN